MCRESCHFYYFGTLPLLMRSGPAILIGTRAASRLSVFSMGNAMWCRRFWFTSAGQHEA